MELKYGGADADNLIQKVVMNGDQWAARDLDKIIRKDMDNVLKAKYPGIKEFDREDIVADAARKLWLHLAEQYSKEDEGEEVNRNAYLRTTVINTAIDYFKKMSHSALNHADDIDEEYWLTTNEDLERKTSMRSELIDALRMLIRLNNRPDKLMSMIYSTVLYSSASKNSAPKKVAEEFSGVRIPEMYERMVSDIETYIDHEIPEDVFHVLKMEVYSKYKDSVFSLTASQIADSTYRIKHPNKEDF